MGRDEAKPLTDKRPILKIKLFLVTLLISPLVFSSDRELEVDLTLAQYLRDFRITSPSSILNDNPKKYKLGKLLFEDKILSLANDVSCKTCHNLKYGTGDDIPFSIGVGGKGEGRERVQSSSDITSRNAPHLFNKGHNFFRRLFWDGRVSYNSRSNSYQTPEINLNGENPPYSFISKKIENVMAMQALFPMLSEVEMKGKSFPQLSNLQVWNKISKRVIESSKYKKYIFEGFNIADIANALAYFQKIEFQVNDTPLDIYILGNKDALSSREKKGALVFFENGRCVFCHFGPHLTNGAFQSVSVPQVGPGQTKDKNDEGRYLITKNENDKYKFLTQPLRNIALTAPFFHNGAFNSLAEVVEHYNNPMRSIHHFDIEKMQNQFGANYNKDIYFDRNRNWNNQRLQSLDNVLKRPLRLSEVEKRNLVCFLKKSLTQKKFHKELSLSECE